MKKLPLDKHMNWSGGKTTDCLCPAVRAVVTEAVSAVTVDTLDSVLRKNEAGLFAAVNLF